MINSTQVPRLLKRRLRFPIEQSERTEHDCRIPRQRYAIGPMPSKRTVRKYARVALPNGPVVAWEHMGVRKVSLASVLALGGLFILTPDPPPAGDLIKLVFEVPGGEVRARALVRTSEAGKGMGIEFTAMKQDARARLDRLMKRLTRI